MQLPNWLDKLIFDELGANYCPQYSDMTNIDDDKKLTLNYLGTYFPRSFAESYTIFSEYFNQNQDFLRNNKEISIFDFGSGTGGEIIGLLIVLDKSLPNLEKVNILALDGNHHALRYYERILDKVLSKINFKIENKVAPIIIDDFYDLRILNDILNQTFDIVISFKAICEFVTKQQFDEQNPYEHLVRFMLPKIRTGGLLLIEDITTYSDTSQEWLPMMMDRGLRAANCSIIKRNEGYNQTYLITHSRKQNDKSKVAWRIIKK